MTKRRAPLSLDAALARIAGFLPGAWDEMGAVAGCSPSLVRKWADPDARERIPFVSAQALDQRYQDLGGEDHPLLDWYARDFTFAVRTATAGCPATLVADSVRESAEAHAATIAAFQPEASPAERAHAARETEEAIQIHYRTLALLRGASAELSDPQPQTHQATGPPA